MPSAQPASNIEGMADRIVILGGGTAGTIAANRLSRQLGESARITVIDRDDRHLYEPGLLLVPFEMEEPESIVRSRGRQLRPGVELRLAEIDRVLSSEGKVLLGDGSSIAYDVLIVATGASLLPGETEGLMGSGWGETVHSFYSLESAVALRQALRDFEGGKLLVAVADMPIKCPVAPLELCFLSDWRMRERGIRDSTQITLLTPLDGAFTKPTCNRELSGLLTGRGIEVVSEFATGQVDADAGKIVSYDGREAPFDLAVVVPVHGGAEYVSRSPGLGDELGWVRTDPHTLQSLAAPNVFAIGDAADLPTSKAGSAAHFQAATLTENVRRHLSGEQLVRGYDGHVNCFIETGFHKALLIDFDYEREPLPGRYPDAHLGPLPLLAESRLNHLAKLAFQTLYWHVLLPGHDIPGVDHGLEAGERAAKAARGEMT